MASPEPLQPYRKVQAGAEQDVRGILEETARAIQNRVQLLRPGIGGEVRAAQLRLTLAAIRRLQREMWVGRLTPTMRRAIDLSEKAGEDAVEAMTRAAYAGLPEAVANTLIRGLRASAASGLASDRVRKRRALSRMVYRQAAFHEDRLEKVIRQGIISGLSARELAKDAYEYVSPTAKGGASYAAMRLARTEINNALHERQIEGAKRPGVKAVQWNLSGSHRVPDLCNVYAAHGGNGHWAPDNIPEKPHPQCFCYLTYITQSPEAFIRKLEDGGFDDEIDRRTRENMARLGQRVGVVTPENVPPKPRKKPTTPRKAAPKKATVTPIRQTIKEASNVPSVADIKASVASGVRGRPKTLSGGAIAITSKLDFNDGTSGVQKVIEDLPPEVMADIPEETRPFLPSAKAQQDAEELGSMVARAFGLNAPQVLRTAPDTTIQQFKAGKPGITMGMRNQQQYYASEDGLVMAMLDQVIGNDDRNLGNWLGDGDRLIPIDFSGSWSARQILTNGIDQPMAKASDDFQRRLRDPRSGEFIDNELSQDDMDRMEEILQGLREEFSNRGQIKWWEWSMDRIDALRVHAKGKGRRIK